MDQNLYNKLIVSLLFKGKDKKNATHKLSSIKIGTDTIKVVYVDQFTKERDAVIATAMLDRLLHHLMLLTSAERHID